MGIALAAAASSSGKPSSSSMTIPVIAGLAIGIVFVVLLFAFFAYSDNIKSTIPDGTRKIMQEIAATRDLPEALAFLKVYPDSMIKVTPVGERTVQVSYLKEVYLTNYDNNVSSSSSSITGNSSTSIDDYNSKGTRDRAIALAVIVDSITFNPSNSVVSCYPIDRGVDADSARGTDIVPSILQSKTRCFGGMI